MISVERNSTSTNPVKMSPTENLLTAIVSTDFVGIYTHDNPLLQVLFLEVERHNAWSQVKVKSEVFNL